MKFQHPVEPIDRIGAILVDIFNDFSLQEKNKNKYLTWPEMVLMILQDYKTDFVDISSSSVMG